MSRRGRILGELTQSVTARTRRSSCLERSPVNSHSDERQTAFAGTEHSSMFLAIVILMCYMT
jgi:hypothetical protein